MIYYGNFIVDGILPFYFDTVIHSKLPYVIKNLMRAYKILKDGYFLSRIIRTVVIYLLKTVVVVRLLSFVLRWLFTFPPQFFKFGPKNVYITLTSVKGSFITLRVYSCVFRNFTKLPSVKR